MLLQRHARLKKCIRCIDWLTAAGFDEAYLARIHAPIGLDIGVVSPAEIALSILAEIIATPRRDRRRSL